MVANDRNSVPFAEVFRWAAAGTMGVLLVLTGAYGLYRVRDIVVLAVIALFLAISIEPVVRFMTRKGLHRLTAITLVFVVLVGLAVAFIWSLVPPITDQGGQLIRNLPAYLDRLSAESRAVQAVTDRYHLTERLTAVVGALPAQLTGGAVGFFQRFIGTVAAAFTVLVLTVYFTADMPRLRGRLLYLFPSRKRRRAGEIVDVMATKVGEYMIGNIIISAIAGATSFACLQLLGVPYALPLAVIVALADLIPMIGATLGATVCVAAALFTVGLWPKSIVLILFFVAYQSFENYLLAPRVLRNTVDLPSAVVLLVALAGGTLLGVAGAVMAIPIAATLKVAMSSAAAAPTERASNPAQTDAEQTADA